MVTSLPSAPGPLSGVFTNETDRREGKKRYERKPQHKQDDLKYLLSLIEEAIRGV